MRLRGAGYKWLKGRRKTLAQLEAEEAEAERRLAILERRHRLKVRMSTAKGRIRRLKYAPLYSAGRSLSHANIGGYTLSYGDTPTRRASRRRRTTRRRKRRSTPAGELSSMFD